MSGCGLRVSKCSCQTGGLCMTDRQVRQGLGLTDEKRDALWLLSVTVAPGDGWMLSLHTHRCISHTNTLTPVQTLLASKPAWPHRASVINKQQSSDQTCHRHAIPDVTINWKHASKQLCGKGTFPAGKNLPLYMSWCWNVSFIRLISLSVYWYS